MISAIQNDTIIDAWLHESLFSSFNPFFKWCPAHYVPEVSIEMTSSASCRSQRQQWIIRENKGCNSIKQRNKSYSRSIGPSSLSQCQICLRSPVFPARIKLLEVKRRCMNAQGCTKAAHITESIRSTLIKCRGASGVGFKSRTACCLV